MKAKLFKYLGLPCALVMLGNTSALADGTSASGTIREYHLNSQVPGRGVCIQLNPTAPVAAGWLCLWKDNPLYQETTDILREAYSAGKTCSVVWFTYRGGTATIESLECFN